MRIPIKIKFYKKSPLATIVDWLGTLFNILGVIGLISAFTGNIAMLAMLIFLIIGIACKIMAPNINEKKVFKLWFKELKEKGIEQEITRSVETAIAVYQANPHKRTLEYINVLNPQASDLIQRLLAEQNKTEHDS